MARRQHLSLMVLLGFMAFLTLTYFTVGGSSAERYPVKTDVLRSAAEDKTDIAKEAQKGDFGLPSDILKGGAIAPKLENATIKAELGRSSWRLLHTMMARFPEKPTADDSLALKTYIQLFARLYPCGDCAAHFQKLLAKYPPQVSSRNAAAGWACFVHNEVNARLKKPLFDCNNIGDFYDCGCGDDDKKKKEKEGSGEGPALKAQERKEDGGGGSSVSVEKEGLTRGG